MNSRKSACPQRTETGPVDSRTTEVIRQLRLHAEDLALELAVRLRVLGKTLNSACPEQGSGRTPSSAYKGLRRQLDSFFASVASHEFAGERYFDHIRSYLQDALPPELGEAVCAEPCRIELVDEVVSLLSEVGCGNDELESLPAFSFSL